MRDAKFPIEAAHYDDPTSKQISRDDVTKVANNLDGWPQCYPIQEAAAMLRSLMGELEEATGYWKKLAVMEADARTRAEKAEAQLAAANERAEKAMAYSDHLQDCLSEFSPLHEITKVRRDMLAETDQ